MYLHQCLYCGVEFQTLFEGRELYCTPEHEEKHSLLENNEENEPITKHTNWKG